MVIQAFVLKKKSLILLNFKECDVIGKDNWRIILNIDFYIEK